MKDKQLLLGALGLVIAAAMFAIVALVLPQPTGQKQADGVAPGHSSKNFATPLAGVSEEAAMVAVDPAQQSQRIEPPSAPVTSAAVFPSAVANDPDAAIMASEQNEAKGLRYTVQDAGLSRNFVLALDEVWVADGDGKGRVIPVAASSREQLAQTLLAASASGAAARAVLYEEGADRNEFTRRVVSPLVTVQLSEGSDPAEIARLAGASSFETPDYAPGFAVLEVGPGLESLLAAERLGSQPATAAGQWKLRVQDLARYDAGTLNSWSLTLTTVQ